MDFNIEETFEVFIAVAILTVAIIMVISASPLNYLHHHIKENPSLLIYHLGGQILYRSTTVLYNMFFVLSRFMPRRLWGDLFWPKCSKNTGHSTRDSTADKVAATATTSPNTVFCMLLAVFVFLESDFHQMTL